MKYRVNDPAVRMRTADGRIVPARAVTIDAMAVGRFGLRNVLAVVCDKCQPLLGQSTLSFFDIQSSRVQEVEFLTLAQRRGRT